MLALTRRIGEEVVIGDPCNPLGVIRIMEIHGDKVRLSFDFPKDTPINRKELAQQKARQLLGEAGGAPPQPPAPSNGQSNAQSDARADASAPPAGYTNPRKKPSSEE